VTKGVFFHGDVRKSQLKEIGNVIAREHGFGEYTMAISGHKHFRKIDDKSGLLMHQTHSLSGSDRWHDGTSTPVCRASRRSFWAGNGADRHAHMVRIVFRTTKQIDTRWYTGQHTYVN
jgi:hypothetical protein